AAVPSPLNFFDGTIHMGPAVVLRGTPTAVDYYKLLLAELQDRVKNKIAAVPAQQQRSDGLQRVIRTPSESPDPIGNEKYRLYWEGMPIWGKLRPLSELFNHLQTCIVASTYCNSWIFDTFNPADPFNSMARAYLELFIVRSDEAKEEYLGRMVKKFRIDGIIFHDAKTCPNNTNVRYGMPQRLKKRFDIPSIIISGDLNDLRCYSEEQSRTMIEAFVEQLGK
ncbi:MAG: 2-hydroxyacyl-CoA dehydratase family protein, partial [Planctomycetota bacterium]